MRVIFLIILLFNLHAFTQNLVKEDYKKEDPSSIKGQQKRSELFIKYLEQLQIKIKSDLERSGRSFQIVNVRECLKSDRKLSIPFSQYLKGRLSSSKVNTFEMQVMSKISMAGIPKEKRKALEEWESESAGNRKKILILRAFEEVTFEFLEATLTDLGYDVSIKEYGEKLSVRLRDFHQVWLFSGYIPQKGANPKKDLKKFKEYLKSGKGLYILADNDPYLIHANMLSEGLHDASISGFYKGQQMIDIFDYKNNENLYSEGKTNWAYDHELLTGIYSLYEGDTISNISDSDSLEIVLRASDGKPLVSTSQDDKELIVYDCGYTRLMDKHMKDPYNTRLWIKNVATYLNGHKRSDLNLLISEPER